MIPELELRMPWTRETDPSPTPRAGRTSRAFLGPALALAALLGGCGPDSNSFAPACPQLRLLRDGGDMTRFSPRGHDVTDLLVAARISAVPAACKAGAKGSVQATMHVNMDVRRGPALAGRSVTMPYFVAIMQGDQVLQRQNYAPTVIFPAGLDQITVGGDDIDMTFPVAPGKTAADYTIYVSFQLTPEELQYNRSNPAH